MASIAQVEPLTTARALRGPFDYALPETLRASVSIGSTLVIPFGRQQLVGVVVGLSDRSDVAPERLLAPHRAQGPGVPADLVELADWMAEQYCSTRARALSLVLPASVASISRLYATITPAGGEALDAAGVRLSAGQRQLLERLRSEGPIAAARSPLGHGGLRRLSDRGLLTLEARTQARRPEHVALGALRGDPPPLTAEQRAALDVIGASIEHGTHAEFLLHGVTGSGKTEVYLRAAAQTLQRGRSVIVLVPEIGLTPQTVGRFIERFGDTVAVLHSGLSAGERNDEWLRLRSGEARICVGPRSAVFAPVTPLGLVIVDEEHDSTYKHEGDPRYDAREVAARRAHAADAILLCGSATPRPESYVRLQRLRLAQRVDGRQLPAVEVIDMRGVRGALHTKTAAALADLRSEGGKGIVLLNRRGWSNFLSCQACGNVWGCPQCDVALVLHNSEGIIACHHCGHRERVPNRCGSCGSNAVARHGVGTERLEHELGLTLGDFPVFRLDADVAARKDAAATLLARFEAAPQGLLIGTQMIAKGHDFNDVALGVVLDADATLRFPDFRAEERTFSLIAQLAGRTGRGRGSSGKVLVQTLAPTASSIVLAAHHDSDAFLLEELTRRRALNYPPYGDLIRVVCSCADADDAVRAARTLRERIGSVGGHVLGPAPLFRLRGRARAQLVIKAHDRGAALKAVGDAVAKPLGRDISVSVDVDPQ